MKIYYNYLLEINAYIYINIEIQTNLNYIYSTDLEKSVFKLELQLILVI